MVGRRDGRAAICHRCARAGGYIVIEATGSEEATAILGSDAKVDAVFSEVQLPGEMDGFGLAQWIRGRKPKIEVILTSGDHVPFIPKPYDPDVVARQISSMLAPSHILPPGDPSTSQGSGTHTPH
jgi:CheY-like chemotaxis protein